MNKAKIEETSKFKEALSLFNLPEDYFILDLGIGLQYEYAPSNIKYSAPYKEMGETLWISFEQELYLIFCDVDKRRPKDWVLACIEGEPSDVLPK